MYDNFRTICVLYPLPYVNYTVYVHFLQLDKLMPDISVGISPAEKRVFTQGGLRTKTGLQHDEKNCI